MCTGTIPSLDGATPVWNQDTCLFEVTATADIPCGSSGFHMVFYLSGGPITHAPGEIILDDALPHGPSTSGATANWNGNCATPGTYNWAVRIECPDDGHNSGDLTGSFTILEKNPELSASDATIDSDACTFTIAGSYHSPCGVKDATWTAKVYHRKGTPSALADADQVVG